MFDSNFWKKTCVCFVIILPVLYLLAIFTSDDKTDKKELSHSNEPHSQVVPKVTKLKTQGFGHAILACQILLLALILANQRK